MKKGIIALLMLILVGTMLPTGTALLNFEQTIAINDSTTIQTLDDGADKSEKDRIDEEYEEKVKKCDAIKDDNEQRNCYEEAEAWYVYKLKLLNCEYLYADSPSELNECKLKAWDEYQIVKKFNRAKAECYEKYEANSEELRDCLEEANFQYIYELRLLECTREHSDDPVKELQCKQDALDRCERMKGDSCLL